MGRTDLIVYS